MANVKFSAIVADARGAVGGVVFGRGGGGAIARTNIKPCNPRSTNQNSRRAVLAQLSQRWSATLTEPQRTDWRAYAANASWTNKVGTSANISGMAAYVRLNSLLLMAGITVQDNAPTQQGHAGTPSFTITANPTGEAISVAQPTEPFDKNITDSRMVFFVHAPVNAGRLRPSGTKRYMAKLVGSLSSPPTLPLAITSPYSFSPGQRMSVTGIYIDVVGRVGGDYTATVVAAVP